ncbi:MAG: hypothetical protein WEB58_20865 [Planctomycetaceae bacterium]
MTHSSRFKNLPERRRLSIRLLRRLCQPGWDVERHEFLTIVRRRQALTRLVETFCRRLVTEEAGSEAVVAFNALLSSTVVNNDRPLIAFLHHSLAAVYRQVGQFALASLHQQSAGKGPFAEYEPNRRLSASAPSLLTHADLFSAWGQDALIAGEYELARDYFWRALRCEQGDGNAHGEAADWGHLGILECAAGAERTGLRYLWKALSLHRHLGDAAGQVHDLMNLSVVYERRGRTRLSLALLRHAQVFVDGCAWPLTRQKAQKLLKRARHLNLLQQTEPLWN